MPALRRTLRARPAASRRTRSGNPLPRVQRRAYRGEEATGPENNPRAGDDLQRRMKTAEEIVKKAIEEKKAREKGSEEKNPQKGISPDDRRVGKKKIRNHQRMTAKNGEQGFHDMQGNWIRNPPLHEGFPGGPEALRRLENATNRFFGTARKGSPKTKKERKSISRHLADAHNHALEQAIEHQRLLAQMSQSNSPTRDQAEDEMVSRLNALNRYREAAGMEPVGRGDLRTLEHISPNEDRSGYFAAIARAQHARAAMKKEGRAQLLRTILAPHVRLIDILRHANGGKDVRAALVREIQLPARQLMVLLQGRVKELEHRETAKRKPALIETEKRLSEREAVLERIAENERAMEAELTDAREIVGPALRKMPPAKRAEGAKWLALAERFIRLKHSFHWKDHARVQLVCEESLLECFLTIRKLHAPPRRNRPR